MGLGKHPVFRRERDEQGGTHSGAASGFRKPSVLRPVLHPFPHGSLHPHLTWSQSLLGTGRCLPDRSVLSSCFR